MSDDDSGMNPVHASWDAPASVALRPDELHRRDHNNPPVHPSWDASAFIALRPDEFHGRDHDAFAVAIGAGIVVFEARLRRRRARRSKTSPRKRSKTLWCLTRPLLTLLATFLSHAAGLSLPLSPSFFSLRLTCSNRPICPSLFLS